MNQFRKENKRSGVFTRRALLLGAGQVGILAALGAKLYQVQVVEGERYATLAESNRISARLTAPPRGRILDRFGIPVAGNKLNWRALLTVEQTDERGCDARCVRHAWCSLADHERVADRAGDAQAGGGSSRWWCANSLPGRKWPSSR